MGKGIELNPLEDGRWDALIESHPAGSLYLTSSWLRVVAETYPQARLMGFGLEREGRLAAALPAFFIASRLTGRRIVSLPFTPYCVPVADSSAEVVELLEAPVRALAGRGAAFFEWRTRAEEGAAAPDGMRKHDYHVTHVLDLAGGFDRVKRGISSNIVTNRKRAVKAGVTVRAAAEEADWRAFYAIHAVTRRKQGFPIQPYAFFGNMRRHLEPAGRVRLLLAEVKGRPVAGIVLFVFKDTVSYEIGASLPDSLEARPNHLLLWEAVEGACAEGRARFDFGKSPPDNPGLVEFKRRWGAESIPCPYYYYPSIAGVMAVEQHSLAHRAMRLVFSRAPLPVARLIGREVYRHLG